MKKKKPTNQPAPAEQPRSPREHMEQEAAERSAETIAQHGVRMEVLQAAMNSLYADWLNCFDEQQTEAYTKNLKSLGVEVKIQHFTGDNSSRTEYTISYGEVRG